MLYGNGPCAYMQTVEGGKMKREYTALPEWDDAEHLAGAWYGDYCTGVCQDQYQELLLLRRLLLQVPLCTWQAF